MDEARLLGTLERIATALETQNENTKAILEFWAKSDKREEERDPLVRRAWRLNAQAEEANIADRAIGLRRISRMNSLILAFRKWDAENRESDL
jgi:hypothetical protein